MLIVQFRRASKPKTCFNFILDDRSLKVVSTFKHLGLVLHVNLYYNVTAQMVAKSAGRALDLMITKSTLLGGIPFNTV